MDIVVPAIMDELRNWGNTLTMMGRLKPGVTRAQAQAEVDILMPQLRAAHKDWYDGVAGLYQWKVAPVAGGAVVRGGFDSADRLRESI
jgi:hypothetical protein